MYVDRHLGGFVRWTDPLASNRGLCALCRDPYQACSLLRQRPFRSCRRRMGILDTEKCIEKRPCEVLKQEAEMRQLRGCEYGASQLPHTQSRGSHQARVGYRGAFAPTQHLAHSDATNTTQPWILTYLQVNELIPSSFATSIAPCTQHSSPRTRTFWNVVFDLMMDRPRAKTWSWPVATMESRTTRIHPQPRSRWRSLSCRPGLRSAPLMPDGCPKTVTPPPRRGDGAVTSCWYRCCNGDPPTARPVRPRIEVLGICLVTMTSCQIIEPNKAPTQTPLGCSRISRR
jgi:hypothetical protein